MFAESPEVKQERDNQLHDEIVKQQFIAQELLHKIYLLDPEAVLAGGAPRDWYMGVPAKDLDFYIRSPMDKKFQYVKEREELLTDYFASSCGHDPNSYETWGGVKLNKKAEVKTKNYAAMPALMDVFTMKYKGMTVDLIFIKKNFYPNTISNSFDCSLSKIMYKHKRASDGVSPFKDVKFDVTGEVFSIEPSIQFMQSFKSGVVTYSNQVTKDHPHAMKMIERFPQYKHVIQGEIIGG